jgi:hypothetical protein
MKIGPVDMGVALTVVSMLLGCGGATEGSHDGDGGETQSPDEAGGRTSSPEQGVGGRSVLSAGGTNVGRAGAFAGYGGFTMIGMGGAITVGRGGATMGYAGAIAVGVGGAIMVGRGGATSVVTVTEVVDACTGAVNHANALASSAGCEPIASADAGCSAVVFAAPDCYAQLVAAFGCIGALAASEFECDSSGRVTPTSSACAAQVSATNNCVSSGP